MRQIKASISKCPIAAAVNSGERHMRKQCTGLIRNLKSVTESAFRDQSWMEVCGADFLLKLAPQGYRTAAKRYNKLLSFLALFW